MVRCTDLSESVTCRQLWTGHFQLEDRLSTELWQGIAVMAEQPGRARATAGRYTGEMNVDTVLAEIDRAEATINAAATSLDQSVGVIRPHYNVGTLMALQLASNVMAPFADEPTASSDDQERIRAAADELIMALRNDASIDINVKRILFEHAEAILRALNLIEGGGAKLLVDERERLTGRLVTDRRIAAQTAKSPSVKSKLLGVLNTLLLVTNLSHNTLQLPADLSAALSLTTGEAHVEAPADPDALPADEA